MIKTHEFARRLLAGPDLPIVIPVMLDYVESHDGEGLVLSEPVTTEISGVNNATGEEGKMISISFPPYIEHCGDDEPTPQGLRERAKLVHEILCKMFEELESFKDEHIGAMVVYLILAILDGKPDSNVSWPLQTSYDPIRFTRKKFEEWFPPSHDVWKYILSPATDDESPPV